MSQAYERALAFTLGEEGGLANRPGADRGGRTFAGVTQLLYDSWRDSRGLARQPVDLCTDEERQALYFEEFWTPCRCEEMPGALAAAVFDMAVNSGPTNAAIALQQALRVRQDGQIGLITLTAAANAPASVLLDFLKARAELIHDDIAAHPADVANLHGWINRLLDFQDQAHRGAFA